MTSANFRYYAPLLLFTLGVSLSFLAQAEELSAFEKSLMMNHSVSTKETIVQMGGRKFRKVEYQNQIVYLALMAELSSTSDLVLLCGEQQASQFNRQSPALVTGAVRISRRTRFFVEGIKAMCSGDQNKARVDLAPEIAVGFMFDDSADPNAILKNRRITINPFNPVNALGFSADW